jgi:hypothetical protein
MADGRLTAVSGAVAIPQTLGHSAIRHLPSESTAPGIELLPVDERRVSIRSRPS